MKQQTNNFKLPYFERTSPSGEITVRWFPMSPEKFGLRFNSMMFEDPEWFDIPVAELPWFLETLCELLEQKVTFAISGSGAGGGSSEQTKSTFKTTQIETTLRQWIDGIPVTVGSKT